jgi:microcompartment protein CcmL/EutN
VEAGAEAAAKVGELVCTNIIPSAHEEVFDLLGEKKGE